MGTSRPKDSGYAWVILLASLGCCYVLGVLVYFVGVINVELLERYHDDVTTTAWTGALFSGLCMLGAPLATCVVHHYSCRVSTVLGGAVLCVGFAASAFTTTVYQLIFTYGIVAGTGLGLTYTPTLMVVTFNFDRYRALASGVSVSGFALGILSGSLLTQAVINVYGINGAFLIIAGFAFNSSVFGMLFRPTEHEGLTSKKATKKGPITAKADSITEKGFDVVNNKPLDMTIVVPSDNEFSKVESCVACGGSEPNKTHHERNVLLLDSEALLLVQEQSRTVGYDQTADCYPHVKSSRSSNRNHTPGASQLLYSNGTTSNTFPTETGRLVDEENECLIREKPSENRRLLSEEKENAKGDSSPCERPAENGHLLNEENKNARFDTSTDIEKPLANGRLLNKDTMKEEDSCLISKNPTESRRLLNEEKEKARVDTSDGCLRNEEDENTVNQCSVRGKNTLFSINGAEEKIVNQYSGSTNQKLLSINGAEEKTVDQCSVCTKQKLLSTHEEEEKAVDQYSVNTKQKRLSTHEEEEKAVDQYSVSTKQKLLSTHEEEEKAVDQRTTSLKDTLFTKASSALDAFKPLLCNGAFVCHAGAVFTASFTFSGGFLHLPEYAVTLGTSHTRAAFLFVGAGSFSLFSRLLAGVLLTSPRVDGLVLSVFFMAVHGVASCLFPLYSAPYWGQMVFASFLGLSNGAFYTLINVLMSKLVSFHLMTRAYGLLIFSMGVGYITGPPMAGMIVDAGGTYEQSFFFLGLVILASAVFDLLAYIIHKRKEKGKGRDPV